MKIISFSVKLIKTKASNLEESCAENLRMYSESTKFNENFTFQAFQHLIRTDRTFVSKLHQAYVESLNTQLH